MQIKHYKESIKLLLAKRQYRLLLVSLFVLTCCTIFTIILLDKANPVKLKNFEVKSRDGKTIQSKIQINKFEDNTYSYRITNNQATIQINKANINPEEKENYIFVDKPTETEGDKDIKTDILFVDDTDFKFESANVTLKKQKDQPINAILKCETWDFDKEKGTCNKWEISDIVPNISGEEIAFDVSHFSAYAGAYLEVLNVQSDLTVNDTWEVRFRTYGTSNLDIQATEGTVWGTDISYINFYCGDNEIPNVYQDNKVFLENYNCDGQISRIQNTAATPGIHTLNFKFGETDTIAHNFACDSGTLADTCNVTTTQAMTNGSSISGTGSLVIKNGGNLTTSNAQSFSIAMDGSVTIESGGNITGNLSSLTAASLDVQTGGNINANSKGSTGGTGANGSGTGRGVGCGSSGCYGGGAGYGGTGGKATSNAGGPSYGSIKSPTDYGSGGGGSNNSGTGGSGGGAVKIVVTGTLNVGGNITANGGNGGSATSGGGGGGSGGSIWVSADSITGSGNMNANGGNGNNTNTGAGGGGRIAVFYTSSLAGTVTMTAYGGATSGRYGGAGSIFKKSSGQPNGDIVIDNNNQSHTTYQSPIGNTEIEEAIVLDTLTVTNYGALLVESGTDVSYTTLDVSSKAVIMYTGGTFTLFDGTKDFTVPQTSTLFLDTPTTFHDLTIDGSVVHHPNGSSETIKLDLTVTGDMTVSSTGSVNLDTKGYTNRTGGDGYGPGAGNGGNSSGNYGSGASHGGTGGNSSVFAAGAQYGSIKSPTTIGSSGGGSGNGAVGGLGGGAAKITVTGTLTVNGPITANASNGTTATNAGGGGGAGGSIWITAASIAGSSSITANGGNGGNTTSSGGGSGGRIALFYGSSLSGSITISAYGGTPSTRFGAAGTIYKKSSAQTNGELIIDNNNQSHSTYLAPVGTTKIEEVITLDNITVSNYGAWLVNTGTSVTHTAADLSNEAIILYTGGTASLFSGSFDLNLGSGGTIFDSVGATYGTTTIAGTYNANAAATFGATTVSGTYNQNANSTFGDTTISGTYNINSTTTTTFGNVTLSGTMTHTANASTDLYKANITANGNFTITGAGSLSANGKGFAAQNGTGAGGAGTAGSAGAGGGGYGGAGGSGIGSSNAGTTYGSSETPILLGSGGGNNSTTTGGAGGGAIRLTVTGTLSLGTSITANGSNAGTQSTSRGGGGGSGGSIYITTYSLTGTGNITANGGTGSSSTLSGHGGGGGGGRIEVFAAESSGYSGSITVSGGTSSGNAGADGTTYVDLIGPVTAFTNICDTSGNSCTTSGSSADPEEAFIVTSLAGTTTESDTEIDALQISIKDTNTNKWYNSSNGQFDQDTEQKFDLTDLNQTLPYAGAVTWQYDVSSAIWTIDHTYTITAYSTNPRVTSNYTKQFVFSNSPPTVSSATGEQASTGELNVTYDVSDNESSSTTIYLLYQLGATLSSDLNTGTGGIVVTDPTVFDNSGTIVIDDEMITYTSKVGSTLSGITRGVNNTINTSHLSGTDVWRVAESVTGNVGSSIANGTGKSLVWNAKDDIDGFYHLAGILLKVFSNDGASSSMTGSDETELVPIDVNDPDFSGNFRIDASLATPLIYVPCSDESGVEVKIGTASDLSGASWRSYSSSYTFAAAGVTYSPGMTVYAQCIDPLSNTTTIQTAIIPGIPSNVFYQDVSNPALEDWREFLAWGVIDSTSIAFESYEIYRSENGGSYSLLTTITNRLTNYYVDTNLDETIEYRYKIRSIDANDNISAYSSVITDIPNGDGGTDLSSPTISGVSIGNVTATTATITWTTNKFSNSNVYFEATNSYPGSNRSDYDSSQGNPSMATSHSVILSGLNSSTTYSFLTESTDASDNIASSSNNTYQFTTAAGPQITNVSVTEIFDTQATITWKTNIDSTSYVVYSENADLSSPTTTAGSDDLTQNHSVTITGLEVGTDYYFYVRSKDGSDNTTEDKNIVNGSVQYYFLSTTIDNEDPVISNVVVALTGEKGATITWSTDEDANSTVEWGTSSSLGQTTEIADIYTTYHSISLTGLTANTKYYYKVKSKDRSNNESENAVSDFTTNDVTTVDSSEGEPTLEEQIEDGISSIIEDADQSLLEAILEALANNPNLEDISDDTLSDYLLEITSSTFSGPTIGGSNLTIEPGATTATVSWVTNRPSNSMVAYVKESEYNSDSANPYVIEVGDSSASVTEHTVVVEGLQPETTYHIQSRSKGSFGPMSASADNIFTTTSQTADIDSIEIRSVNESGATLAWNTTIPTRSRIIITDTTTGQAQTDTNDSFITGHSYTTEELTPSTNYSAQVVSIDENGNETESSIVTFATVLNSSPPIISDVRVTTSLVPGKVEQVQTIISWKTNKPATSKIIYDEGVRSNGELRLSVPEDTALRREHIVISSVFSSGKVYSYKIQSTDTGGNTGESQNYTLLTPQPRESVVDLIVKNLEEMFGFLK